MSAAGTSQRAERGAAAVEYGQGRRRGGRRSAVRSPDQALTVLYESHYRPLTQLATLLAGGDPAAEEIVQDAFVAMHAGWPELRDDEQAELYLLRTVVRRCRSRQGGTSGTSGTGGPGPLAGAQSCLIRALHALPPAQREAVLLNCVATLPVTRVAEVMGVNGRTAREHLASGLRSLAGAEPELPGLPGERPDGAPGPANGGPTPARAAGRSEPGRRAGA
jgi:DNA-directed RNA polymerase specialized sigma24 family protein